MLTSALDIRNLILFNFQKADRGNRTPVIWVETKRFATKQYPHIGISLYHQDVYDKWVSTSTLLNLVHISIWAVDLIDA